jgi:ADP-ribose pyrophosphatase YjhB (NUDIX family)
MDKDRKLTVGVGGVVVKDGKVLMVRKTYSPAAGYWMIPGGYLKAGEMLAEGASREIWEEAGVKVQVDGIIAVRSRVRDGEATDTYVVFSARTVEGEPRPDNREVDGARYFSLEEVMSPDSKITDISRYLAEKVLTGDYILFPDADWFPSNMPKETKSSYIVYTGKPKGDTK